MGSIRHHTDQTRDLATFTVSGTIAMADVERAAQEQLIQAVTSRAVWDFRDAIIADADLTSMRDLVQATRGRTPSAEARRVALIVNCEMHAVMGRLYLSAVEQLGAHSEHEVFLNLDEAIVWLHEEPSGAEPSNILPFPGGTRDESRSDRQDLCG